MEKIFIKNRRDMKVAVVIEQPEGIAENEKSRGLAFVMHGLGGFKEQKHIRTMAEVFLHNHYTVVTFDTTNTFGESDGIYDDATTTNYYEDLQDVIGWSKDQPWYQEPFCLSGHSLGGISTILFAEHNASLVKGLIPMAPVVSGRLSMEADVSVEEWKRAGSKLVTSNAKPDMSGTLPWAHMEDRLKYDVLPLINMLKMPVLIIVGTKDALTPVAHELIMYDALPGPKEIKIIEDAPHTFKDPVHVKEIYECVDHWIGKLQ